MSRKFLTIPRHHTRKPPQIKNNDRSPPLPRFPTATLHLPNKKSPPRGYLPHHPTPWLSLCYVPRPSV